MQVSKYRVIEYQCYPLSGLSYLVYLLSGKLERRPFHSSLTRRVSDRFLGRLYLNQHQSSYRYSLLATTATDWGTFMHYGRRFEYVSAHGDRATSYMAH